MPKLEGRKPTPPEPLIPTGELLVDSWITGADPYARSKRVRCVACGKVFGLLEEHPYPAYVVRANDIDTPAGVVCGACTDMITGER